ncbi:MAG: putative lipoprotein [Steroidobacteraceae bacterium]|nr:putative lipoprotein [Steroidobacteraceae bacterium]
MDVARAADQATAPTSGTASATDIASMTWDAYASAPSTATGPNADKIKRGKYVATIAGCNDCHTPFKMGPTGPEPDLSRMLSGHPEQLGSMPQAGAPGAAPGPTNTRFSGPWGVSFTANLTPDVETGLGQWTFRNFKDTIRSGRHMGRGRPVLPPMPIMMYKHMTDEDLEALFTYLQTIPAIRNRVPEPLPPATEAAVAATPSS